MERINVNLKEIRSNLCLNQEEMGHILGCSRQWYNKMENDGCVTEDDAALIKMRLQELAYEIPDNEKGYSELFSNYCCLCHHCVIDRLNKKIVCEKSKKDVNKSKKDSCDKAKFFNIASNVDENIVI